MGTESSAWLSLGSAVVIDWKHLGRAPSARGATAWVRQIDGEPIVLRAWGEDTTSYFEFMFLSDERIAGKLVVAAERSDKVRMKTTLEVDSGIALVDTVEYKEHPRTLLFSRATRTTDIKGGTMSALSFPPLPPQAAEVFEVSPDGALLTHCGDWIVEVLTAVRDHLRGVPAAQPRAKTEQAVVRPPGSPRTLDGSKKAPAGQAAKADGNNGPAQRSKSSGKLVCTTNSGESFDIIGDETYVGRSKQCAIVLKSQRVSRKHACITREGDGYYINDLGAANGIWAGSEKIDREKIKAGDQYIVGDVVLSFDYQ
jgi:hypothetical protein